MRSREWMQEALCASHPNPDLWFPSSTGPASKIQIAAAARICMQCPVAADCDMYRQETGATFGVWGGDMVRNPAAPSIVVQAHGTESGYRRHRTRGEKPCAACRTAASTASRARRERWVGRQA